MHEPQRMTPRRADVRMAHAPPNQYDPQEAGMTQTLVALYDTGVDAQRVVQERPARWRQEGWPGSDTTALTSPPTTSAAAPPRGADTGAHPRGIQGHEAVTIPVVEEDLVISTREVERGFVRIYSRVTVQPV